MWKSLQGQGLNDLITPSWQNKYTWASTISHTHQHGEFQGQLFTLQLCNNWHLSGVFAGWDSPSAMCYLTNQWIAYKLPIDLNDAHTLSEAICITPFICVYWLHMLKTYTRVAISWLYPCNKSSYIRFVYSQYHVEWVKCTEQNVNNQNLTQVSQLYVHVSFCLKVIRSCHNLPTGGHGHVICMLVQSYMRTASRGYHFFFIKGMIVKLICHAHGACSFCSLSILIWIDYFRSLTYHYWQFCFLFV